MNKILKVILNIILIPWQLPQIIVGLIILSVLKAKGKLTTVFDYKTSWVFWHNDPTYTGVSLGPIIILNERNYKDSDLKTVKHEYGHCIQSFILGSIYLLIIGFVSLVINNLLWKVFYPVLPYFYYSHFPELWADQLGGVLKPGQKTRYDKI